MICRLCSLCKKYCKQGAERGSCPGRNGELVYCPKYVSNMRYDHFHLPDDVCDNDIDLMACAVGLDYENVKDDSFYPDHNYYFVGGKDEVWDKLAGHGFAAFTDGFYYLTASGLSALYFATGITVWSTIARSPADIRRVALQYTQKSDAGVPCSKIVHEFNIPYDRVRRAMRRLEKEGKVIQTPDRYDWYRVSDKEESK